MSVTRAHNGFSGEGVSQARKLIRRFVQEEPRIGYNGQECEARNRNSITWTGADRCGKGAPATRSIRTQTETRRP